MAILIAVVLVGWLVGSQVQLQFQSLSQLASEGWQQIREIFGLTAANGATGSQDGFEAGGLTGQLLASTKGIAGRLLSYGYLTLEVATTFVLLIVGGVFLAGNPEIYRAGLVKLFPPNRRGQIRDTLDESGETLRKWLIAQLISMATIGAVTTVGTWAIGLPAPLALGLIAGLLEFIPIIGPIASAVPALLLATTESWTMVLWTLVLYVAIQQIESDVVTPLIQQEMVKIPAGLLLLAATVFGLLFGIVGVIIGAPLAVVTYAAVKKLYDIDTLGEHAPMPTEEAGQN